MVIKRLKINSFLSFESAELNLSDSKEIILVEGENLTDFSNSNGSGKSSLFEAILWGLFKKSFRSEVRNLYSSSPLSVEIELEKDGLGYRLIRGESSLKLYRGEEDLGMNATPTAIQKLVDEIVGDYSSFSRLYQISSKSMMISSMSPKVRAGTLIELFNLEELIEEYKKLVEKIQKDYEERINKIYLAHSNIKERLSLQKSNLTSLMSKLESSKVDSKESQIRKDNLKREIEDLNSKIEELSSLVRDNRINLSKIEKAKSEIELNKINSSRKISDLETKIKSYEIGKCPECGQIVDKSQENRDLLNQELSNIKDGLLRLSYQSAELEKLESDYNSIINKQEKELRNMNSSYIEKTQEVARIKGLLDSSIAESEYLRIVEEVEELDKLVRSYDEERSVCDELIKQLRSLSRKNTQFSQKLLSEAIEDLNIELGELSQRYYKSEIKLELKKNEIAIYYAGKEIDILSSGEKRRVDFLIALAIRELEIQNSESLNMLVIDEVLDTLDSSEEIMQLLSERVDSNIFIVSHNKGLDINYDRKLIVRKENNISEIIEE